MLNNNKGQFTIIALLSTVMVIFAFVALYPVISDAIDSIATDMDAYSATLLKLTPFFIVLTIILTIIYVALPVSGS